MKNKVLGIIPAKGRSNALPDKNLHPFCGKPLVQWTIEASMQSKYITRTVVSSDNKEIIALSQKCGADIIERPAELATDSATCQEAVLHCINCFRNLEEYEPEVLVLLQPTSPLRTRRDIDMAMELYFKSGSTAVISGYELDRNPLKEFLINDEGNLTAIMDDSYPFLSRQFLPRAFRPNGAIYIANADLFMKTESLLTNNTRPFFMDKQKSIDIDNMNDLKKAEKLLRITI